MEIKELQNRINKLEIFKILQNIFKTASFVTFIIDRNQEQLYDKGITARGTIIKTYKSGKGFPYSPYTVAQKAIKGQKVNIVTLKDTGDFYKSFKVKVEESYLEIDAEFEKSNGNIGENLDITEVLGLTEENKNELIEKLKPVFLTEIKKALLK
jgi:hypothetical protein